MLLSMNIGISKKPLKFNWMRRGKDRYGKVGFYRDEKMSAKRSSHHHHSFFKSSYDVM